MRTCPACGEDTKAGYAEPCSECGFSPTGEQAPAEPSQVAPEVTIGDQEAETPEESSAGEQPAEEGTRKKRPAVRGLFWLVVIAAAIGADATGVFDEPPGPDAAQVEQAIVDDARQYGATVTVDCPDDADQTEVDESFKCTATNAAGDTLRIKVTNHEDSFEWVSGPLSTLA